MSISKQHRILVVGTGSIGERHVRCFAKTNRASVGIVELNPELRTRVAGLYGIHHAYSSPQDALADEWDAAVIATPTPAHIPVAILFAERDIHLLIEKPVALRVEDVQPLQKNLRGRDLVVGIGYIWRAHPLMARMREMVQSGQFGRPVQIHVVSGQNFPFYRPAYRQIYYASHAQGGGGIQDALTHLINAGEWLVGPTTRITVDASHQVLEGVDVEDTVHAITRHANTVMGAYIMNQHQAPNETRFTVVCDAGTIRFEPNENRLLWMTKPGADWEVSSIEPMERDAWYIGQANAFLDAIERRSSVLCSLEEGVHTLRAIVGGLHSSQNALELIEIAP
jgi:predicted dehydrogenase